MASCDKMQRFCYMNIQSYFVCYMYCLLMYNSWSNPTPFTSLWGVCSVDFIFMILPGYNEKSYNFFSSFKKTLSFWLHNNQSTNLQNYTTHPWLLTQILVEKPNCVRTIESEKNIYFKKLLWLLCIDYSMEDTPWSGPHFVEGTKQ